MSGDKFDTPASHQEKVPVNPTLRMTPERRRLVVAILAGFAGAAALELARRAMGWTQ